MTSEDSSKKKQQMPALEELEDLEEPNAMLIIGLISAASPYFLIRNHRETYEDRTKAGRLVYYVELPILVAFSCVFAIMGVTLVLLGGVLELPGWLAIGYKRVVYKDEV